MVYDKVVKMDLLAFMNTKKCTYVHTYKFGSTDKRTYESTYQFGSTYVCTYDRTYKFGSTNKRLYVRFCHGLLPRWSLLLDTCVT